MAQSVAEFLALMQRESGDVPPDPVLAQQWLQRRYESVLERAPFSFLQKEATVQISGEVSAGTVSVTLGSTTVTETTSNANGWSSSLIGRYFRLDSRSEYYRITAYGDANPDTLTLERGYEGPTATVQTYSVFRRYYALATDVREILNMVLLSDPTRRLEEISQTQLQTSFSNRPTLAPPIWYALSQLDSSNDWQVEFYPIPDTVSGILYQYIQETPSLANGSTAILPQVGYGLLRSGWLADYWSWRGSQADSDPSTAVVMSQQKEAEFEKRLAELLMREAANQPITRLRIGTRFVSHRGPKFGSRSRNILLP